LAQTDELTGVHMWNVFHEGSCIHWTWDLWTASSSW